LLLKKFNAAKFCENLKNDHDIHMSQISDITAEDYNIQINRKISVKSST